MRQEVDVRQLDNLTRPEVSHRAGTQVKVLIPEITLSARGVRREKVEGKRIIMCVEWMVAERWMRGCCLVWRLRSADLRG